MGSEGIHRELLCCLQGLLKPLRVMVIGNLLVTFPLCSEGVMVCAKWNQNISVMASGKCRQQ